MPRGQADGFFKEAELWVVKAKRLIHDVRRRLHLHLQDGDGVVVFIFKCNLQEEVQRLEHRRGEEGGAETLRSAPVASRSAFHRPQEKEETIPHEYYTTVSVSAD